MKPTETNTITTTAADSLAAQLLRAGRALGDAHHPVGVAPYTIVPEGYRLEFLPEEKFPSLPDHIRQFVRLDDPVSFCAYVKEFRTHTTRIFATAPVLERLIRGESGGLKFTALIDYHEAGKEQTPQRVAHKAEYPCPLSLEVRTWLGSNGKALSQTDFVNFIEANCADVVTPDSASLMEMALNFEAKTSASFSSKIDRVSGGRSLQFSETVDQSGTTTAGQMKVPENLVIRLPIFEGGKAYEIRARLEYRAPGGKLTIAYHLQRPQEAFRMAIVDLRKDIETATELPVFTGEAGASN